MADEPIVRMETAEPRWEKCEKCGGAVTYTVRAGALQVCGECEPGVREEARRRIEGEQILVDLDGRTEAMLEAFGLSKRDRLAELTRVPELMRRAVPRRWRDRLEIKRRVDTHEPLPGFGVAALAGAGKTSLFSALLREITRARLELRASKLGRSVLEPWAVWLSWPSTVDRLRLMSLGDGGLEAAHQVVQRAASAELLILDDLGAERIRGAAADDWAASQLDLIVDARDGAMLPTWYSSTMADRGLAERYGQRLFSRLVGRNPMHAIKGTVDQRLAGDPTC